MSEGPQNASHEVLRQLLAQWWDPPAELIATLPKGGVQPKYLGHSDTSRALTEADPSWTWEPMGYDDHGQPVLVVNDKGQPIGMWGWLTVCGVRRPAYGSCMPGKGEAVKELIGDLIRNGAMRFGVAGGLWSKADRSHAEQKPEQKPNRKVKEELGRVFYDEWVAKYGKETVNGALATFGISRFQELVPEKCELIEESLKARAAVVAVQEGFDAVEVEGKS